MFDLNLSSHSLFSSLNGLAEANESEGFCVSCSSDLARLWVCKHCCDSTFDFEIELKNPSTWFRSCRDCGIAELFALLDLVLPQWRSLDWQLELIQKEENNAA